MRAVLPQIRRPTLIVQRRGDCVVRCGNGRFLADHVPDAVYLELPGDDHMYFLGDTEAMFAAVSGFAGAAAAAPPVPQDGRFLATVLFTDIVGSTELAGRIGDTAWRDLLQQFLALCRAHIAEFRGREIDTAGDGEVWVSSTAKDLVAGSGIAFDPCGTHALKGVGSEWALWRMRGD